MKRREFISLFISSVVAWPLTARAQQPAIGFLSPGSPKADTYRMNGVRRGLAEIGYVEGQNVAIEYRGAQYQYGHLPALAVDLVSRQVSVIIVVSITPTLAAKAATNTIPIVFVVGGDPVQFSVVTSLNRPVGNITGVYNLNIGVVGKRLELLRELIPATGVVALLVNPRNRPPSTFRDIQGGARVSQSLIREAFMMTRGSSSNTSPGIWLALILGGLLVVFVVTALTVSILIHS
jgi:putative ABC transport system substrate-binding protein